jgi:hypothetical protein
MSATEIAMQCFSVISAKPFEDVVAKPDAAIPT